MRNDSISSVKLVSCLFFFFVFISCKDSPSKPGPVKDSLKAAEKELPTVIFAPPVLQIGKSIDYKDQSMLGSSLFTPDDTTFAYFLLNHKKFGISQLNLRFYRLKETGSDLLESVIIEIDPEGNVLSDSFELRKVYNEFGKGEFEMQFLNKDTVVAARSFALL